MGRQRATKQDQRLPPYVYRKARLNLVEFRQYLGKGLFGKSVYLRGDDGECLPFTATVAEIHRAYAKHTNAAPVERTLAWLLEAYFKSPRATRLAPKTLMNYRHYEKAICASPLSNGRTFGEVPLPKLSRPMIAKYRDSMTATQQANRHLQFLSAVFNWGLEQGYVMDNAAQGVSKNPAPPRDRYVTDWEYRLALSLAPDWLCAAMQIAYLCRARRGEVLALPPSALTPDGLLIKRSKGSKTEVIQYSPELTAALDLARGHNRATICGFVIHNADGSPIKESAFNSAWRRLMKKFKEEGGNPFPFHDLKAAGYSDAPAEGAGHKSAKMHDVYMRVPEKKKATK